MKRLNKLTGPVYFIMTAAAVAFVLVAGGYWNTPSVAEEQVGSAGFGRGWQVLRETGSVELVNLPASTDALPGETVTIRKTLPELPDADQTLLFYTTHQAVRVTVGGQPIYSFGETVGGGPIGSPGFQWHFVKLSAEMSGKEAEIAFSSPLVRNAKMLCDIRLGSRSANLLYIFSENLVGILLCLCIFLLGVTLILIFIMFHKRLAGNAGIAYLGVFAVTVSAWSIIETRTVQFVIDNVMGVYTAAYVLLQLIPLPMLLFVLAEYRPRRQWPLFTVFMLCAANFAVCAVMQFTGLMDYAVTVPVSHLLMLLTIAAIFASLLPERRTHRDTSFRTFMLGFLILTVYAFFDFIRYYFFYSADASRYFRIGFLIFVFVLFLDTLQRYFSISEYRSQARAYRKLAYLDVLTGMQNRTAFDRELEKLWLHGHADGVLVLEFDLNDLKATNDRYGHKAGDESIAAAASAILAAFRLYGKSFRIGGDEFATILEHCTPEKALECVRVMQKELMRYNLRTANELSVAYGYAQFDPRADASLHDTLHRADRFMYRRKGKMKYGEPSPVSPSLV